MCAPLAWILSLIVFLVPAIHAEPFHKTSDAVGYKCIFNHELLIISHNKTNSASYIKAFIEKLKDTDVGAVR
jgi:hypothetical protein